MNNKRVLICSVSAWNQRSGADTFSTLMDGYGADKVANIYIREELPDSKVCNHYFRISENAVLKSIFRSNTKTGKQVSPGGEHDENKQNEMVTKERYQYFSKHRRAIFLWARELVWKIGKWKTKELDSFIESFDPEVVFFPMEGYIHLNRISRYVIKKTGAKGIGYFWDDNFTFKTSKKLSTRVLRIFKRREIKKCVRCCTDFFAISPKTKEEADAAFKINCKILTKPVKCESEFKPYPVSEPIKMLYTGKLIIGRFETIQLIGKALDEINKDGNKVELDVYTTTVLPEEKTCVLSRHVHLLGAIPQSEVHKKQKEADVLLFAEAIGGPSALSARLSFSTKLTDYFGSGRCILAVGNIETAPMEYLKQEDAAFVADSYDDIVHTLQTMLADKGLILEYAKKGFDCGRRNHKKEKIQEILFNTLNQ